MQGFIPLPVVDDKYKDAKRKVEIAIDALNLAIEDCAKLGVTLEIRCERRKGYVGLKTDSATDPEFFKLEKATLNL
jgi:hypothetical protein